MTWSRREVLGSFGIASAQALMWACGGGHRAPKHPTEISDQVRGWLRDAVAKLHAEFPDVHALAVSRRRTTAAIDVLGAGVGRGRWDSVVLAVADREGRRREQVTSDVSRDGVERAAGALLSRSVKPATIDFGKPLIAPLGFSPDHDPRKLEDITLLDKVAAMANLDSELSSRIIYAAAMIDIDDATLWSVAQGRDQEQRLVRVRRSITRAAWNGTRPIVSEAARGFIGHVDAQTLEATEIKAATRAALTLMTPSAFEDGARAILLESDVTAAIVDATARALLTTTALRRPEVASRLADGTSIAPALTLVDDPTVPSAYGGYAFDDEGQPATKLVLLDAGRVVGRLADRASGHPAGRGRRPGHTGPVEPAPSHLRLLPGTDDVSTMLRDGFVLQGVRSAIVDAASDRVVIAVAHAKERRDGKDTGRVFADVELVGSLATLLGSVTAVSSATQIAALRDEVDGQPRWRSIEAPSLQLTGTLRTRRGSR